MDKIFDDYKNCWLVNIEGENKVSSIRQLSEEDVLRLVEANAVIYEFIRYDRRMREITYNYEELVETIRSYADKISLDKQFGIAPNFNDDIYVNVNRKMSSLITSLCVFVDHIEERRYIKDKVRLGKFKLVTSTAYDLHFSYRLFYNLRNFSLHNDFPVNIIKIEKEQEVSSNKVISVLKIYFDKNQLLSDSEVKRKLKKDLIHYNKSFPINFAIEQILIPLKIIFDGFLTIEKSYFQDAANTIMVEANKTSDPFKAYVAKLTGKNPISTFQLPVEYIERLRGRILSIDESSLPKL